MAIPRVGIIEAILFLVSIFILAAIASPELFALVFTYAFSIAILFLTLRESVFLFLAKHKVLHRDLNKPGNALLYALPFALLIRLLNFQGTSVNFTFLGILITVILAAMLGLFIQRQYEFKESKLRPYAISFGLVLLQLVLEVLFSLVLVVA